MFSTILDISSFFIGMLINLLLIALICYYFKRKYETLEASQNEQAKILYNLIQNQIPKKTFNINDLLTNANVCSNLGTCMINPDDIEETDSENGSDTESEKTDNESDDEFDKRNLNIQVSEIGAIDVNPVKILSLNVSELNNVLNDLEEIPIVVSKLNVNELNVSEVNDLTVNELNGNELEVTDLSELNAPTESDSTGTDYSKLSIKQLKDILTKKGINSNHRMKKTDLINLIEHGHNENTLNLKDEIEEVNI
jgi:hypothetical protein